MKSSRKRTRAVTDRTPPETLPAADLIANNVDLLTQILLRSSAKSLIRFKSVSKHWLSLISDSRFASSHSRLNPKPLISSLYFYYNKKLESVSLNGSPTIPPLPFLPALTGEFKILHSCNGLLLIGRARIVDDRDYGKVRYIVCNPTTQKYSVLTQRFYESGVLAFDPSKSPHYKVVLLTSAYSICPSSEMDIYSSETACWKRIFLEDRSMYEDGAFWNGAVYWLCDRDTLLRFDVETEKMVWIPYAESGSRILPPYRTRYFGECGRGGRLILIQTYSDSAAGFKIREMDKDYFRWNVKFRANLRPLISAFPEIEGRTGKFPLMCVVEGEKKDDLALILAILGKVISYNLKKKTWNVLRDLAPGEFLSNGYGIFPFAESLSPV